MPRSRPIPDKKGVTAAVLELSHVRRLASSAATGRATIRQFRVGPRARSNQSSEVSESFQPEGRVGDRQVTIDRDYVGCGRQRFRRDGT